MTARLHARFGTLALSTLALIGLHVLALRVEEPQWGFTRGEDIEWNMHHLATFHEQAHRQFHEQKEKKYRLWLASMEHLHGSKRYEKELREYRKEHNKMHRLFHAQISGSHVWHERSGSLRVSHPHASVGFEIWPPSRRLIRELVEKQQKEHERMIRGS